VVEQPGAELASRIVWFDAYVTNVDRTARNTNMLMWHRRLWLIDHGATLYFHHARGWPSEAARAGDRFPLVNHHVLLRAASLLEEVDAAMAAALTPEVIAGIVGLIPDRWLGEGSSAADGDRYRSAYGRYLLDRLAAPRAFVDEAVHAR
jgi:hypothetical protein